MRMFATTPEDASQRTAVPVDILRRLAFGRPQRGAIKPSLPAGPAPEAAAPQRSDARDLDQRVRESGEW
jgi:hypothetical protein